MASLTRTPPGNALPDFPWDTIADVKNRAAQHPDGIVNLSVGTPVDDVAEPIRDALTAAAAEPGYPQTTGTPELNRALVESLSRRYNMTGLTSECVLPVIGTKEAIALLPMLLGVGAGHTVIIPEVAYPTYEVSALMSGARPQRADSLTQIGPATPTMMFINSPSNPTGKVLGIEHLRKVVGWAQDRGVILCSDECYIGLGWDEENPPLSILDERVCGGDHAGLIAIHSLSKSSNMASYRAGVLAGDGELIGQLLEVRKHCGLMMPGPIQAAMVAALDDDAQEAEQKERYRARRDKLLAALTGAGFTVDYSEAGLYLWATRDEDCRTTLDWFAERGILVAPGDFYGPKGARHVRMALTGTDERIDAAVARLA
ncbi:succinyldiaminopimelate transaminase [Corynebacterium meridianum]|uniref:Succinyldiaminopimelate transaminase n=1 Tax=Corynebacterium meridianum TaxID=2765363 RepID=A0A934M697_9CORY|nr:succinyldiaminopimelate transaminase [Corynebacterium meridianum]MBI8988399.1 succinyldiaminopimelate transaminase [Corynebacterium meridianum]MCK7678128.1 succinyldiaminopimelate transaminase [Corynebacterium meridianum]